MKNKSRTTVRQRIFLLAFLIAGMTLFNPAPAHAAEDSIPAEDPVPEEDEPAEDEGENDGAPEDEEIPAILRSAPPTRGLSDTWYEDFRHYTQDSTLKLTRYTGEGGEVYVPATAMIDGVEYNIEIVGSSIAFFGENVVSVTFAPGVKVSAADALFYGCKNLESVDIKEADFSEAKSAWELFDGCSSLKQADLSGMDFSSCENFFFLFAYCSSLEQVDITGINTPKGVTFTGAFCRCPKLTQVIGLADLDWAEGASFDYFFQQTGMETIDLSFWDMRGVKLVSGMFANNDNLTTVDLSGWDCSDIEKFLVVFALDKKLTRIKTPAVMNTAIAAALPDQGDYVYVEEHADGSLGDVPYTDLMKAPANATLVLVQGSTEWQKNYEYILDKTNGYIKLKFYIGSDTDIYVPAEAKVKGVTYKTQLFCGSWGGVYQNKNTIESITFEDGVTLGAGSSLCEGCTSLKTVTFGNMIIPGSVIAGNAFAGCTSLTEIDMSGLDLNGISYMSDFFKDCDSLMYIHTPAVLSYSASCSLPGEFYAYYANGYPNMFRSYTAMWAVPASSLIGRNVPVSASFTVRMPALVETTIENGTFRTEFLISVDFDDLASDEFISVMKNQYYATFSSDETGSKVLAATQQSKEIWSADDASPGTVTVYANIAENLRSISEWHTEITFTIRSGRRYTGGT